MYSVVLMAALTTGSATPAWHHWGGCCGGCFGGCHGCCGGGWGCGGCCGGGCCGGGCYGCFGGCYGGGYGGGYGGYGGYGCWGGYSSWGFGDVAHPGMGIPGGYGVTDGMVAPGTGIGGEELGKPTPNKKNDDKETMVPTRAKLIVELPANAKLFVDNMPVKVKAGVQTFNTPVLEPGRPYFYMVRIERMRDGEPVSETRRIIVRAGQVARADFQDGKSETVRTAQAK